MDEPLRGGVALDSFRIGHEGQLERVLEPERWERVQQTLAKVLRGQVDIAALKKRVWDNVERTD